MSRNQNQNNDKENPSKFRKPLPLFPQAGSSVPSLPATSTRTPTLLQNNQPEPEKEKKYSSSSSSSTSSIPSSLPPVASQTLTEDLFSQEKSFIAKTFSI